MHVKIFVILDGFIATVGKNLVPCHIKHVLTGLNEVSEFVHIKTSRF